LLSIFLLAGCSTFAFWNSDFTDADRFLKEKKYNQAASLYAKIAKESPGTGVGASALFASASTRMLHDNPNKDYALALQDFEEFLRRYPNHDKAPEAKNWKHCLKTIVELQTNIEQLKRVDIRHEEKRKGK
jgi:outer membrane protein assembly factor BamD (BamD/ComL family)